MNDEELRAFLDSATVEGGDGATGDEDDAPESATADAASAPGNTPPRVVPSFDELMNMPGPDSAVAPAQRLPEAKLEQPKAKTPVTEPDSSEVVVAAPTPPSGGAAQQGKEWSQAFAQEDEQLVPLILPGFSSAPQPRRDLPPVFRAEPAAPHIDPAPTQPFDVLADQQASPEVASESAKTPAAVFPAAAAAVSTAAAATAPLPTTAPTATAAKATATPASQSGDDPFALLAPDLVASDSSDDEYERIAVTGGAPRDRKMLPWLIVGGGVVIAIIASIFVINGVRGDDAQAPTEKPAVTGEPTPGETTPPEGEPEPSEEPAPEPGAAPVVDPGSTWTLPIEQWNMTVEVSEKLGGRTPYTQFDGNSRVMFDSLPLAAGISDACAAARAEHAWGLRKTDDGKLEVIRPEPRCSNPSDAAVYDTIWGVLDYMAKSAKPA